MNESLPFYDVIIVGAGLSGIGAAYHVQSKCKDKSIAILEARESMGGTWDLFNYPGIRSDSDMYTLGFSFNPWTETKTLADGPSILQYIKDTAKKYGIDEKIQYNHKVLDANWSDEERIWTVTIANHNKVQHTQLKCRFLFMCSGYYNYEGGHDPDFEGSELFQGKIIHPQKWDPAINYDNKKVVVIGSGATAVTMVPEMAKRAEKVTMLQRSPTYVISLPGEDVVGKFLGKILPMKVVYPLIRWKNILISMGLYQFSKRWPGKMRQMMQKHIKQVIGKDYDIKHFDPHYKPWDQRLCIVPEDDLFKAIKEGKAEVVTDTIERFTEKGMQLSSGEELEADLVVKATGLRVQLLGGMTLSKNGEEMKVKDLHVYRGVMFSNIPNFAIAVGYTNASWTLKCDLNCHFVTRIINHMDQKNAEVCTPRFDSNAFTEEPLLDIESGYIQRAKDQLPQQGSKAPWKVYQNYIRDLFSIKLGSIDDEYLEYK